MTQPQYNNINNSVDNNTAAPITQTSSYAHPYGSYGATATTSSVTAKNTLPAFLNKLFGMVNSPETDPWVHWNAEGTSFIIPNAQDLAEHVLGRHFKHNNFASFVRQLNMYGFHKVPHLNHGVLHTDGLPEVWEFTNDNFQRDRPGNMKYIVRKKGEAEKARSAAKQRSTSPGVASPVFHQHPINDSMDVAIVRAEVQNVASRQKMIRDEVFRLSTSQENLWKYAIETRERYTDHQDKIDRIIKFLSEAFRKRTSPPMSNSEVANKVRGLIEPPQRTSVFEELSDTNTPTPSARSPLSPNPEQAQVDIMKMFANGKVPAGFHEAVQYLMNMNQNGSGNGYVTTPYPTTPLTPTSPALFDSSDALIQANAFNNAQLGQVQSWLDTEDQNVNALGNGLGIDLTSTDLNNPTDNINYMDGGNPDYTSYLTDAHFQVDPFIANTDPALDIFSTDSLQPVWSQYLDPADSSLDANAFCGQKRTYEQENEQEMEEYLSSAKKVRS